MKLNSKKYSKALLMSIFLPLLLLSNDKTISLKYPIKDIGSLQNDYGQNNNSGGGYANNNRNNSGGSAEIMAETLKNKFEIESDESIFQKTINSRDKYNKLLNETIHLDYMLNPETRPLKSIDTLYIHPNHITTIVLPLDMELKTAKASFQTDVFELNENTVLIKPNRDFNTGNIVVTATNKNKNYVFNFILRKIEVSFVSFDSDYNKYLIENNYLSLIYQYERKKTEDKFEILQKYIQVNDIKSYDLDKVFQKEGDFDILMSNGIAYYIIKDSRFGEINYADINFRIDTKYSFAEKSNKVKRISNE
jgi:hypothetical protein